ncbi:triose-phosphate isomerase [Oxalobacteraceae bacterium R-40]|uniref:Triosephosphate isomerase n=1 Tax=Keguizhuia sedimenti TaxID=3064264 RepID=A0ABU1BMK1_9BURK|nr:triose-phosphate isomerase [Oxalobacteraceae bacterium R-40]
MRRKLVAGNWKMNGSLQANRILLEEVKSKLQVNNCEVVVCPPAPYLQQCQAILAGTAIGWGAQDISMHAAGAFTGEVSAEMLRDFDCSYVIVGHSERRSYHAEHDEQVAKKVVRALANRLTPIVCVGETLPHREAGMTAEIVSAQIEAVLGQISPEQVADIIVAYEPVWAIGTGKTATPEMAQEIHALLRRKIAEKNAGAAASVRILYGGSVKPDNAEELFFMPDIDGGLIGGASLKANEFLAIIHAV